MAEDRIRAGEDVRRADLVVHSKIVGTVCGGGDPKTLGWFYAEGGMGGGGGVGEENERVLSGLCGEKSGRSSNLNFPPSALSQDPSPFRTRRSDMLMRRGNHAD
jgi:hypothetical protein